MVNDAVNRNMFVFVYDFNETERQSQTTCLYLLMLILLKVVYLLIIQESVAGINVFINNSEMK